MSGLADDYQSNSYGPQFKWKCPRIGCRHDIAAWTEIGMNRLSEAHSKDHQGKDQEERELIKAFLASRPPQDYNKLKITFHDFVFLTTRHIAIDDDMELVSGNGGQSKIPETGR